MPVVAIAGGTGHLGHALVDGLLAHGGIDVVVLARESTAEKEAKLGAKILSVNYQDVEGTIKVLEDNHIDTVICAINDKSGRGPEPNLIKAVAGSKVTKRYIPAMWGIPYTEELAKVFPPAREKMNILSQLASTDLEWTAVSNGFFLDYWVMPKVKSYMDPLAIVIDMQANTAAIPGTGDEKVVFTHTFDVAKYVAALVLEPKWTKHSFIIGDKVSFNEFVSIAENAKGTKFTVTYDSIDTLKQGQITELPSHPYVYRFLPKHVLQGMLASFGVMFASGAFDLKPTDDVSLNRRFAEIKSRSIQELVMEAWH